MTDAVTGGPGSGFRCWIDVGLLGFSLLTSCTGPASLHASSSISREAGTGSRPVSLTPSSLTPSASAWAGRICCDR